MIPKIGDMTYGELLDSLRKDLLLDATTDLLPGSTLLSLIDQNGRAAFPQLLTVQKLLVQVFHVSVAVVAGWSGYNITYPKAFPTGVVEMFYSLSPATTASILSTEFDSGTFTTTQARIDVNSTIAQNVIFRLCVFGN